MNANTEIARRALQNAALYLADTYGIRDPLVSISNPDKLPIRCAAKLLVALETVVEYGKDEA